MFQRSVQHGWNYQVWLHQQPTFFTADELDRRFAAAPSKRRATAKFRGWVKADERENEHKLLLNCLEMPVIRGIWVLIHCHIKRCIMCVYIYTLYMYIYIFMYVYIYIFVYVCIYIYAQIMLQQWIQLWIYHYLPGIWLKMLKKPLPKLIVIWWHLHITISSFHSH